MNADSQMTDLLLPQARSAGQKRTVNALPQSFQLLRGALVSQDQTFVDADIVSILLLNVKGLKSRVELSGNSDSLEAHPNVDVVDREKG